MKTLIALAAASFITPGAMASGVPSPEGENYSFDTIYVRQTLHCYVHFLPHDEGSHSGPVTFGCRGDDPSPGFENSGEWSLEGGMVSVDVPQALWTMQFSDCAQWPSVEVGYTLMAPCWMISETDDKIELRRDS
ncbi:hypothetical protein ACFELO_02145 [Oceanicaulis sp. LC35]|uniref:hypothetical protein n=1 Tax=Oceanicaulis sp. LC35 TaxID=3349635 RepID=UPI003F84F877